MGRLIQLAWALVGLPLSWALPRPKEIDAKVHGEAVLPDEADNRQPTTET
jgi:hypothetical protein